MKRKESERGGRRKRARQSSSEGSLLTERTHNSRAKTGPGARVSLVQALDLAI